MLYCIIIGNLIVGEIQENDRVVGDWRIDTIERKDRPSFPDHGDLGYDSSIIFREDIWDTLYKAPELQKVFFGSDGVMREQPGCFRIQYKHLDEINTIIKDIPYRIRTEVMRKHFEDRLPVQVSDDKFADRLRNLGEMLSWFQFWFKLALENCPKPAIGILHYEIK